MRPFKHLIARVGRLAKYGVTKAPVTLTLLIFMWAVLVTTGVRIPSRLLNHFGVGPAGLFDGKWWPALTSAFFASHVGAAVGCTILLVAISARVEAKLGSIRFFVIGIAGQAFGALATAVSVKFLGLLSATERSLYNALDVGCTPWLMAVLLAATGKLDTLWRRRVRTSSFVVLFTLLAFSGHLQDFERLFAALFGLAVGRLAWQKNSPSRSLIGTTHEGRVLVSLVLASVSAATILTVFAPHAVGPLAQISAMIHGPDFDADALAHICDDPTQDRLCRYTLSRAANYSLGATLTMLLPQFTCLVLAEGLRRGRRLAWALACVVNLLIAAIATLNMLGQLALFEAVNVVRLIIPVALPLAILVLLVASRRWFKVVTPKAPMRRLLLTVAAIFVVSLLVCVFVGTASADEFYPQATVGALIGQFFVHSAPMWSMGLLVAPIVPMTFFTQLVLTWVPMLPWLTLLIGLLRIFLYTGAAETVAERDRLRDLLVKNGGSSFGWWATWQGNSYWFSKDSAAGLAYRPWGGVALVTADPVCAPQDLDKVVAEFSTFATDAGLIPAFYSVHAPCQAATSRLGWSRLQVAEETILDLPDLEFKGKKFQDVRTAINKAKKQNISTLWTTFADASPAVVAQILTISEEWMKAKKLPEMGYTLGSIDELKDPNVRLLIALDEEHTVHGVTSWLPVYQSGQLVGLTLDFMRRRSHGFSQVMELLIAQAALDAKAEGLSFISLSGAPLANIESQTDGWLEWLGKILEPVYGFRSLLAFKSKFQPRYEQIFLTIPALSNLPAVGLAIGHAYLPSVKLRESMRLSGELIHGNKKTAPGVKNNP